MYTHCENVKQILLTRQTLNKKDNKLVMLYTCTQCSHTTHMPPLVNQIVTWKEQAHT